VALQLSLRHGLPVSAVVPVAQGDDMVPRVVCRRDEARQSLVVLGGVEAVCVVAYQVFFFY